MESTVQLICACSGSRTHFEPWLCSTCVEVQSAHAQAVLCLGYIRLHISAHRIHVSLKEDCRGSRQG